MYRQQLFTELQRRIATQLPQIKHIALWNQDVDFADEDTWPTPALFLEFGKIDWMPTKSGYYRGTGTILLHIVTEFPDDEPHRPFSLADLVTAQLISLDGDDFRIMGLLSSITNHNHEQLVETIEILSVKFARQLP